MLYLATNQATNSIEIRGDYKFNDHTRRGQSCTAYVNYERITDTWHRNLEWSSIKSTLIVYAARFLDVHQADIIDDITTFDSLIESWYQNPEPVLIERFLGFDDTGIHTYRIRDTLYNAEDAFSIRRFRKLVALTFEAVDAGTGNGFDVSVLLHELD